MTTFIFQFRIFYYIIIPFHSYFFYLYINLFLVLLYLYIKFILQLFLINIFFYLKWIIHLVEKKYRHIILFLIMHPNKFIFLFLDNFKENKPCIKRKDHLNFKLLMDHISIKEYNILIMSIV